MNELEKLRLPDEDNLDHAKWSSVQEKLTSAVRIIRNIQARVFENERYISRQEAVLVAVGDTPHTFKARASRYERTRHRYLLKWSCRGEIDLPSSAQPAPEGRPYNEEDPCAICHSAPECREGDLDCPPIVTGCYKKPFHTDCVLEWPFTNIERGMTCPWCRAKVDSDFLVKVMEARVRELQCL